MSVIINPNLKDYFIVIGGDSAPVRVQRIYFKDMYDFTIKVNETKDLELIIEPPEAINYINYGDVVWKSSNPEVARIDSSGMVTGLSEGTTKLTAKIGRYTTSINCKVINPIQFADPLTKKLAVRLWDKDGDKEISYAEAKKVQFIPQLFANSKITSFDELQYFTNVKNISPSAFQGCSYLTSIVLPKNVETIGKNAFYDCDSLVKITIPSKIKNVGYESFANCENLTYVICNAVNPPEGYHMFGDDDPNLYSIKVPEKSKDNYCTHHSWEEYRSYINATGFDYYFDFYLG